MCITYLRDPASVSVCAGRHRGFDTTCRVFVSSKLGVDMRQLIIAIAFLLSALVPHAKAQQATLDIYWIDVEGGAATLIVTPERQSVLMDAGYDREDERDTQRIQAAMADAGITELDYFIASHFHGDHVGGVPALAGQVPIKQFIDHGDTVEQDSERHRAAWNGYLSVAKGNRRSVVPGDELSVPKCR